MHRRALLAAASGGGVVPLAGCPTPPWTEDPSQIDGATVTLRREYDGEIAGHDHGPQDIAELRPPLDDDPPRVRVVGVILGGARECYGESRRKPRALARG